jgi:RNA polymerase sigma-70 factor (ECF subfamily)
MPSATMGRRLSRAKRKIRDAAIPLDIPGPQELPARVEAVRTVIYLIFTEAHAATRGAGLLRRDLAREAIALGKVLLSLLEEYRLASELAETRGLLALMLLHEARSDGRVDPAGELLTLEEQDRSRWNKEMIAEGRSVLKRALELPGDGPYQVEAAIAALHAEAAHYDETDWSEMLLLYDVLRHYKPGMVVEVNRAVVVYQADGPERALESVRELKADPSARHYAPLWLLLGELHERAGEMGRAFDALNTALALTENRSTTAHIRRKLRRLAGGSGGK